MIYEALKTVQNSLNHYLRTRFALSKDKVQLSGIIDTEGASPTEDRDKIAISLINLQQEKNIQRSPTAPGLRPPFHLNLFLLFSVYFGEDGSYEESLKELSAIISFFQANAVMNHQNTPELDAQIDKLVFEFVNQDMQSLNYIWGMLGGKYVPSALYKVRMITIDEGIALEFPVPFTGFGSNTQ
ncbi:MAG: hypothetical protein OHK0053_12030 [Microscillaceae bacterium]